MQNKFEYAAFFDLDNTIISLNSGKLLVRQAYQKGLMTSKDVLKGLYFSILYRFQLKDTVKIIEDIAGWISGLSEETLNLLTLEVFQSQLVKAVRAEIYEEIEFHQKRNAEVIILSAGIPAICKLFAGHLKIAHYICSELEIRDGKYTGRPIGRFCFGDEKRVRLQAYCLEKAYDLENTFCYADAYSDYSVLNAVGKPRCISPDKRLRKLANQKGWQVLDW